MKGKKRIVGEEGGRSGDQFSIIGRIETGEYFHILFML